MQNTKAIIDFSSYTAAELGPIAQHIHDELVANVAVFATPTVTMPAFATLITTYNAKLSARASRATADAMAFINNAAREELEVGLSRLGNYVNDIAQGDPLIVEQSGFPGYVTARSADTSAPGAPENVRLTFCPRKIPTVRQSASVFGLPVVVCTSLVLGWRCALKRATSEPLTSPWRRRTFSGAPGADVSAERAVT